MFGGLIETALFKTIGDCIGLSVQDGQVQLLKPRLLHLEKQMRFLKLAIQQEHDVRIKWQLTRIWLYFLDLLDYSSSSFI